MESSASSSNTADHVDFTKRFLVGFVEAMEREAFGETFTVPRLYARNVLVWTKAASAGMPLRFVTLMMNKTDISTEPPNRIFSRRTKIK